MPPARKKVIKCNYYNPDTGNPDPSPCPRNAKTCWYIHPGEPEWNEKGGGKRLSSPPRRPGGGRKSSLGPRVGRGRSRSRTRSRSRSRSRERGRRGGGRSRSRSTGRYVSPGRKRPIYSSPPRRPFLGRIQRSKSRPRSRSRSRQRTRSPPRHPRDRRPRVRTSTPISSSRASPSGDSKLASSPRRIKPEPSTDVVPRLSSGSTLLAVGNTNTATTGDQTPASPRGDVDHRHQRPPLDLSFVHQVAATSSNSPQLPTPLIDPLSPIFVPETPVIPGLTATAEFTQPRVAAITALQRSLELVVKNQVANPVKKSATLPGGNSMTYHPATLPGGEKTEIWTTRVKLWADLMKAKSEVMEWQDEVKVAQSLKERVGFATSSPEVQAQISSRIAYATANLVQHQLSFEALVSQSISLDRSVSKTNAAMAPAPTVPDPHAATPREVEWMQERIQAAAVRMDELEKKLALQDELLERIKVEQDAIAALPPTASAASPQTPMEVDDGDGVLDQVPALKRKRTHDDDSRPSSRRRSLARTVADLQDSNDALIDRIEQAEGTIEGILNDVVEDPEGEESSRATRLKEIVQDYQTFIENAKAAIDVTERNSGVVDALKTEAELAIADWDEAYREFEVVRNEAMGIQAREKERTEEIKQKEEKVAVMQREIEALNATVQAFVEQQSTQRESPLTLEQVIQALKPYLLEEMREATQPLLKRKHEELQKMLTEHIEAVRVSIYEPISLSENVARTMVTWLEAEFGFGKTAA